MYTILVGLFIVANRELFLSESMIFAPTEKRNLLAIVGILGICGKREIEDKSSFLNATLMNINLTQEAAIFGADLRGEFVVGEQGNRYDPQPKTPYNALIADFDTNMGYGKTSSATVTPRFVRERYPLKQKSEYESLLKKFGPWFALEVPAEKDEAEYRLYLQRVLDLVVTFYRTKFGFPASRGAVKSHVVKDNFRKEKSSVALDVPLRIWKTFESKIENPTDDQVLASMDRHVLAVCGNGGQKIQAFVTKRTNEVLKIREEMKTCPVRFVVLFLGEQIKRALGGAIKSDFEPYLVQMLAEDEPRD